MISMATRLVGAALVATALVGCGGSIDPVPVDFQSLFTEFPGSYPAGTYVFKDQAEMAVAWATAPQEYVPVDPTRPPGPIPMPSIDFEKYSVVGISLGVGLRCFAPHITSITSVGDDLMVTYTSREDTGPVTLACAHTWPLTAFAQVPTFRGSVTFERVSE